MAEHTSNDAKALPHDFENSFVAGVDIYLCDRLQAVLTARIRIETCITPMRCELNLNTANLFLQCFVFEVQLIFRSKNTYASSADLSES